MDDYQKRHSRHFAAMDRWVESEDEALDPGTRETVIQEAMVYGDWLHADPLPRKGGLLKVLPIPAGWIAVVSRNNVEYGAIFAACSEADEAQPIIVQDADHVWSAALDLACTAYGERHSTSRKAHYDARREPDE